MNIKEAVNVIARRKVKEGFQFLLYSEVEIPNDVQGIYKMLIDAIMNTLTLDEPGKYKMAVPILKVQDTKKEKTDEQILAESKCLVLIEEEVSRLHIESMIKQDNQESILFEKFPELKNEIDKDGLLPITIFDDILVDAVKYKDYALYLTVPYRFARKLLQLSQKNKSLRVRLDSNKLKPINNYFERLEEEFYYGPVFNQEDFIKKLHIKNVSTVLVRNPKNELERLKLALMAKVEKFEVNRSEKGEEIFISAEELPPIEENDISLNYIQSKLYHSNFNLSKSTEFLEHADYTTLIYEIDTYVERLNKGIKDKISAIGHYKHFWIGNISFDDWKDLYDQVFIKNELAQEYLTGKTWNPID